MKKFLFIFPLLCILCGACSEGRFHVNGTITGAQDTVLYLEHITLGEGIVPVDSVKLDAEGHFELSAPKHPNPEYFRLRIGGQCVNLAIDSTETVTVTAPLEQMSFGYQVEGSGPCDTIRLLGLKLADLERKVHAMVVNRSYTVQEREDSIEAMVKRYKQEVKVQFIQNHYHSSSSYFACFQVLGTRLLFDPIADRSDLVWMQAVANSWNTRFPESPRTMNICNIVAQARAHHAKPREMVLDLTSSDIEVRELGIIDMTMPDIHGNEISLSSLRGKVVLLDFTAFALDGSSERIMQMREIYNKYHSKGFEIYQVSVDPNRHLWAQRCENLPWISVFCEEGLESDIVELYQAYPIPYYFLIDRNCDLFARQEHIGDLEKSIEYLLQK